MSRTLGAARRWTRRLTATGTYTLRTESPWRTCELSRRGPPLLAIGFSGPGKRSGPPAARRRSRQTRGRGSLCCLRDLATHRRSRRAGRRHREASCKSTIPLASWRPRDPHLTPRRHHRARPSSETAALWARRSARATRGAAFRARPAARGPSRTRRRPYITASPALRAARRRSGCSGPRLARVENPARSVACPSVTRRTSAPNVNTITRPPAWRSMPVSRLPRRRHRLLPTRRPPKPPRRRHRGRRAAQILPYPGV